VTADDSFVHTSGHSEIVCVEDELFHLAGSINDAEIHDITRPRTTRLVAILVELEFCAGVLYGEVRVSRCENYFSAEAIRKPIGLEARKKC
jgi:hypothetical protein